MDQDLGHWPGVPRDLAQDWDGVYRGPERRANHGRRSWNYKEGPSTRAGYVKGLAVPTRGDCFDRRVQNLDPGLDAFPGQDQALALAGQGNMRLGIGNGGDSERRERLRLALNVLDPVKREGGAEKREILAFDVVRQYCMIWDPYGTPELLGLDLDEDSGPDSGFDGVHPGSGRSYRELWDLAKHTMDQDVDARGLAWPAARPLTGALHR